jgi:hypothetical protein
MSEQRQLTEAELEARRWPDDPRNAQRESARRAYAKKKQRTADLKAWRLNRDLIGG